MCRKPSKTWRFLTLMICIGFFSPNVIHARGRAKDARYTKLVFSPPINNKKYLITTQQIITGQVGKTYIIQYEYANNTYRVMGMDIKTSDDKVYQVHLAPPELFIEKGFIINKGDDVIVRGAVMDMNQKQTIIASRISCLGKKIKLRSSSGIPEWSNKTQLGASKLTKFSQKN